MLTCTFTTSKCNLSPNQKMLDLWQEKPEMKVDLQAILELHHHALTSMCLTDHALSCPA